MLTELLRPDVYSTPKTDEGSRLPSSQSKRISTVECERDFEGPDRGFLTELNWYDCNVIIFIGHSTG